MREPESRWLCWVAERDGALVGNVWMQLLEKIPNPVARPEWHGYVSSFFVLPEHRGAGIGLGAPRRGDRRGAGAWRSTGSSSGRRRRVGRSTSATASQRRAALLELPLR